MKIKHIVAGLIFVTIAFFLLSDFSRLPYCYPWTHNCKLLRANYDLSIASERYRQSQEKVKDVERLRLRLEDMHRRGVI